MRGAPQHSTSNHRHLSAQHTPHMHTPQKFNALPGSDTESLPQEDISVVADTTDASSSNSSGRLVLLAGLVAAAALILIASGGVGGLKERVKASQKR